MNGQKIPLAPGLWLVGVPIGTARDITLRALDVLTSADVLAAEDTRSMRKLMDIHGVPLGDRRIVALHDHSNERAVQGLIEAMQRGQSVAYASEAGMPLIADPGFELVRAARAENQTVTSAPGVSAVTTALALGGLPTDAFQFQGFLPSARAARKRAMADLITLQATLVLYESPKRIAACVADAMDVFGPTRPARLCRELTKKFEDVVGDTLQDIANHIQTKTIKGEIVLLIDRADKQVWTAEELEEKLTNALETMSLRDASAHVAAETNTPKRDIYQMGLSIER
ncbi:MAG: 16S rRNA (cytidine(1402)-2'-O)-methyltransferase [Paracoccaceae bacterium]